MVVNIISVTVPQLFQQKLTCHKIAGVSCQKPQKLIFIRRDGLLLSVSDSRKGMKIQPKNPVVLAFLRSFDMPGSPAQRNFHAALQNLHMKGFCNIVVCAQIKAF